MGRGAPAAGPIEQAPLRLAGWHAGPPDTITALFGKHLAAAGLPEIRLHDFRHCYASAALKSGVLPKVVSERLGHTNAAFTMQTSMQVIPGMDAAAANQVADLILGNASTQLERSTDADLDARSER